jgi:hypothetical protein
MGDLPAARHCFFTFKRDDCQSLPNGWPLDAGASSKNPMACKSYELMIYNGSERNEMGGSKALNSE